MTGAPGGLWQPVSPCGPGCLPRGVPAGRFHRACRLAALTALVLAAVLVVPVLPRTPARRGALRALARGILAVLGVRLDVRGRAPRGRALLIANHLSWLDVVVLLAVAPGAVMVAKREVRGWPFIGALARVSGAVFVDRSRPRTLPGAVAEVARALRGGAVVAGFPEGTTWCGSASGRFRPALFQAALDGDATVVPVALSYRLGGVPSALPAFLGGDTLLASVCRVAGANGLTVRVAVTSPMHPVAGTDRRALAQVAETAVRAALPAPATDRGRPTSPADSHMAGKVPCPA